MAALHPSSRRSLTLGLHAGHATLEARLIGDLCATPLGQDHSVAHRAAEMRVALTSSAAPRAVRVPLGCRRAARSILTPSAQSAQVEGWTGRKAARVVQVQNVDLMVCQASALDAHVRQAASLAGEAFALPADSTGAIAMARCWASCSLLPLVGLAWVFPA